MLRRSFDVPPLARRLQAFVLAAFATGIMVLALQAENGSPSLKTGLAASSVSVAP